jgi:hypothetical protein
MVNLTEIPFVTFDVKVEINKSFSHVMKLIVLEKTKI